MVKLTLRNLTNHCTRIATLRFHNDYVLVKSRVIVATIARPQSRKFWPLGGFIENIRVLFQGFIKGSKYHNTIEFVYTRLDSI